ncbi:MAG TPA: hypothetical protein ENF75_03720 [Acidilobales archaeon]|nr:MAG: hypothetical protein DRO18_04910 [Thermoprotei archaeon]HDD26178.1 hypothetical protein [Acidilobales archaeon]
MVIRLRLRVRGVRGREVEVVAVVNSGYEALRPELLINTSIAHELGLYPVLPSGAEVREYALADGSRTKLIRIPNALEVKVCVEDRETKYVGCDAVIAERAEEPLISDKLADALEIVAIAIGEGIWCFRDELGKKNRRSASPLEGW